MEGKLYGKIVVNYNEELDRLPVEVDIQQKTAQYELDSQVTIVVNEVSELDSAVFIRPDNAMYGKVGVVPPPYITDQLSPIKDSLVREFAPHINYGSASSLVAGQAGEGKFKSYLGFSLENLPEDIEVENAKLILTIVSDIESVFDLGLYETSDNWEELTVKWNYMPNEGSNITSRMTHLGGGKIEIDLTEYVKEWYNTKENRSFVIRPINYEESTPAYFGSRESSTPPVLEVSYFKFSDNVGIYHLDTEVTLRATDSSNLDAEVDILSDFNVSDMDAEVEFSAKEDSSDVDADVLVAVTDVAELDTEVEFIATAGGAELDVEVDILLPDYNDIDAEVTISQLSGISEMDAEVVLRVYSDSDLDVEVNLAAKELVSDLDAEVTIGAVALSDLDSEVVFELKELAAELDAEVTLCVYSDSDLDVEVELIATPGEAELDTELYLRVYNFADLDAEVTFEAKESSSEIDAEVSIKAYGDSDLDTEVGFESKEGSSKIEAEAELIATDSFDDLDVEIILRQFWAEELGAEVYLEASIDLGGDYAFII
ncbi:hypothetical protein SAMN05446037_100655 [Anaerovirgula multivorans]|uniref:Carbohydrate-binding module family 96 domain-containing protein n=1 Tax=Anaerovirgula multivorans TaxID=312168 RepID=A0A239CMM1_9FIRM|nr:DNRLRE domain-containing protein [Anaerovirgula multivorans]SNS21415.1 hypothetical protein SAMN05446037_100655 [Anaerovirgula multivorans]